MSFRYYIQSEESENALKNYNYAGSQNSFLSSALNHWWIFCTELTPKWMAPNVITLLGIICSFIGFLYFVFTHYNWSCENPSTVWYLSSVVLIFAYQTLDAVDGKQARRTGSSSPLGELFDHGLDALVTMFLTVMCLCAFQYENEDYFFVFISLSGVYWGGYTTIIEAYITDFFRMGHLNAVEELHFFVMLIIFLSGIFGNEMWSFNILGFVGNYFGFGLFLSLKKLFLIVTLFFGVLNTFNNTNECLKSIDKGKAKRNEGDLLRLFFLLISVNGCFIFLIFADFEFFQHYSMLITLLYGTVLSYLQGRLIGHKLTKQKVPLFYRITYPLPLLCILFLILEQFDIKLYLLIGYFIYVVFMYVFYWYATMREFCEILDIKPFTIK